MRIRWIQPMFGFGPDQSHVAVTASARVKLIEMGASGAGTDDLVAIYIPAGTDDVYQVGARKRRVVGAVRLLPMPAGGGIEDDSFADWDQNDRNPDWNGKLRWPIGRPCRVVLEAEASECPTPRRIVDVAHGQVAFGAFTAGFQREPVKLDHRMMEAMHRAFESIHGPCPWPDHA